MKILVYGINYYPEETGIGKYTTEMCEWLVSHGHHVEVITALPYYPAWKVSKAYQGKGWYSETINGVVVHRGPLYVPKSITGYTRLSHDFSFLLSSAWNWMKRFPRSFDVVFCVYPPLPIGIYPLLAKWLKGTPFIFHVQDLQVDAARQLGIIRHHKLLSFLENFERYFMHRAKIVSTISPGMQKKIINKGVAPAKTLLFPNWVDTQAFQPLNFCERAEFKKEFSYQCEDQIVLYSGNIGEKQGLDTLLEAAAIAQAKGSRVKFRIVGEGAAKKKLVLLKESLGLNNLSFAPLVPKSELNRLLNMADLHIILQKKGASDLVMPSKLGSILACGGVPLIGAEQNSGLRNLIENQSLGITTDAEDAEALFNTIEAYFWNDSAEKYRINAENYAKNNLGIENILPRFENMLYNVIGHSEVRSSVLHPVKV